MSTNPSFFDRRIMNRRFALGCLTMAMWFGMDAPLESLSAQDAPPVPTSKAQSPVAESSGNMPAANKNPESVLLRPEEKSVKKATPDHVQQKELLQKLATASQAAKTATDYSEVIQQCQDTLETNELLSANEDYIRSLIAWSLNRRGELRMELGFEFSQVANSEQADAAFAKAQGDFDLALEQDPEQWKSYLNRGIVLARAKQWDAAMKDLNRSVELRPGQTYAYFNLAEVEYQRGHFAAAVAYYDHLLSTADSDLQALNGKALSLAGLRRFDESLEIYRSLLEVHPGEPWLLTNRGDVYQQMGRWSDAEADYLKALEGQQAAPIYRRLAWLFATCPDQSLRQREGALVLAKKSISMARSTSAAQWDTLAAAQALNGEFRDAMDSLRQALELEPDNQEFAARQEMYARGETYVQVPKVAREDGKLLDR